MEFAAKKKRRQHYVWRHYLEQWTEDGALWCRRDGKVFRASTYNIGHQRDFYRLREISPRDLDIIRIAFINPMPAHLRSIAEGWLPLFTELFELRRVQTSTEQRDPQADEALDAAINNLEEELHRHWEGYGIPLLDALRRTDTTVFSDDEECVFYMWYLADQYTRSRSIQARVRAAVAEVPLVDIESCFGLLRTIMAGNLAYSYWSRRTTFSSIFLRATGQRFITGDHPIVNLRAQGLPDGVPPTGVELYYPLSPQLAVVLDFESSVAKTAVRDATGAEVARFNQVITDLSHSQIYGSTRECVGG